MIFLGLSPADRKAMICRRNIRILWEDDGTRDQDASPTMTDPAKQSASRHTVRRARIIALSMPVGSLTLLFGGAAIAGQLDSATFFSRLTSFPVVFILVLFIAILFPAYMRIYFVLLLDVTGVFTASERRAYQAGKQRWECYLRRAALVAGVLLVGFAVWLRWR
jgi:hypothetical protein